MSNTKTVARFGIPPDKLAKIEEKRRIWLTGVMNDFEPLYIEIFWEQLGKELSWDPLTLCLHYFRQKNKPTTNA